MVTDTLTNQVYTVTLAAHARRGLINYYPQVYYKLIEGSLTIDEEEESSGLVRHGPSNEGLPRAWRAVEEYTPGWFYSDGLEQLRMTQWKLHHLQHPGSILGKYTIQQFMYVGTHVQASVIGIK